MHEKFKFIFKTSRDNMPFLAHGEKHRFNYMIRKLIQNSIERSLQTLVASITVKFYFEDKFVDNGVIDLSEAESSSGFGTTPEAEKSQSYLICEVIDKGNILSGAQIVALLKPPSFQQINNPTTEL